MKVKVVKGFIDKYTKELRKIGNSFFCDEKRMNELKGYVIEDVKETKKVEKEENENE